MSARAPPSGSSPSHSFLALPPPFPHVLPPSQPPLAPATPSPDPLLDFEAVSQPNPFMGGPMLPTTHAVDFSQMQAMSPQLPSPFDMPPHTATHGGQSRTHRSSAATGSEAASAAAAAAQGVQEAEHDMMRDMRDRLHFAQQHQPHFAAWNLTLMQKFTVVDRQLETLWERVEELAQDKSMGTTCSAAAMLQLLTAKSGRVSFASDSCATCFLIPRLARLIFSCC